MSLGIIIYDKTKKRKISKRNVLEFIPFLVIIICFLLICKSIYITENNKKVDDNKLEDFYHNQIPIVEEKEEVKEEQPITSSSNLPKESYLGVLKIPKINLERGFYSVTSRSNNVNRNIEVNKESDMPDVINGNLIIAGHSGNSYISYFRNLPKLNIGDSASVIYNNNTYNYKLKNIYEINKNGYANIKRNVNKTTLTLITCKHNTNKQLVFIFELENE